MLKNTWYLCKPLQKRFVQQTTSMQSMMLSYIIAVSQVSLHTHTIVVFSLPYCTQLQSVLLHHYNKCCMKWSVLGIYIKLPCLMIINKSIEQLSHIRASSYMISLWSTCTNELFCRSWTVNYDQQLYYDLYLLMWISNTVTVACCITYTTWLCN